MATQPMSPDLVARQWLKSLSILSGVGVASKLPDAMTWTGKFFVTVRTILAQHDPYSTLRFVDVQIDLFGKAATTTSSNPPWGECGSLAESLHEASIDAKGIVASPGSKMGNARLTSVVSPGFLPLPDPNSSLARFTSTFRFTYVPISS